MKLESIKPICESVTFHAVDYSEENGRKIYSSRTNKVEKECWVCDGVGYEEYFDERRTCGYCNGDGKYIDEEDEGPELNVSNTNGHLIANMLGLEDDEGMGVIPNEQIPAIIKKLMVLKNTDRKSNFERPTTVDHGDVRVDKSGDVPSISRGPTFYHMGVDANGIERYIDKLLEILKYAQQNKMHVAWS